MNVDSSLFTVSVLLSYSCTNTVTTPPGFNFSLASWKNSLVVERRGATDPWIKRIGCDGIELLLRGEEEVPCVVDLHVHLRIVHHVEVVIAEEARDDLRHQRFDLGDGLALEAWINAHRAGGHTGAAADHEDRTWLVQQ